MKQPLSHLLHRIPWWALFAGGLGVMVALGLFATPYHLFRLEKSGATPDEKRAIKREIDLAFSQSAVDIAHTIVKEMRDHAKDPARQDELDHALEEIETARQSLQDAGVEVQRARREAGAEVSGAIAEAHDAIKNAKREAARALKDSAPERARVEQSLDQSLKATQDAAAEARRANALPVPPVPPSRIVIGKGDGKRSIQIEVDPSVTPVPPPPPLPPEVKREIRKKLSTDLWRIGVGTGLLLIFIPLFILAVVSKFFIDRSRASQKVAEAKKREAEYHRMSRQVTEAKLAALQAQVEPHFLYNTLASVQALTEVDPQKAHEMTGHLIQYLRNALPKMRESVSTVGQEVELVRAYLNILQMRMGKRLAFEIDVAPGLEQAPFPPLMLPSLVENAIKHGLEPVRDGGRVTIRVTEAGSALRVSVADTGRGFGETVGTGVGLTNIRERLAALYGADARLTLEANEPQGVVATIEVPRVAPSADAVRASLAAGSSASTQDVPPENAPDVSASPGPQPGAGTTPPAASAIPPSRTQRVLSSMGTAERAWRKGLTFTFMVLVGVAAIVAALAAIGVLTGALHVQFPRDMVGSAAGAFLGTAGIAIAFVVVVIALAVVVALVYGLGFVLVSVFAFVVIVVLIALFPVLAPFILIAMGIAWLVRRMGRSEPTLESPDADRHPG